eukprot:gene2579-1875_t
MESLLEELERLRQELAEERQRRVALEEECDLLAEDNARLRSEIEKSRFNTRPPIPPDQSASAVAAVAGDVEVFVEGSGNYARVVRHTVVHASDGKNVLSTAVFQSQSPENMSDVGFVGGVDAHLRGFALSSGAELFVHKLPGPVLFIDCCPPWIACGTMDGTLMIGHLDSVSMELSIAEYKNHSKYVVGVRWSPSAKYVATVSYDKSVILYRRKEGAGSVDSLDINPAEQFEKYKVMQFQENPESLVFSSDEELIIGLRGLPHLLYIDLNSYTQRCVSLNEHEWDQHVSYVPLALSLSPCKKYLLVATDKHVHLVFRLGTNNRVRIFSGHNAGDYGKPSVAWDASGTYIYSNSEEESAVYVYSLGTQRVERRLTGHNGFIRSLAAHPTQPGFLITGSYDKTVKFWTCADV